MENQSSAKSQKYSSEEYRYYMKLYEETFGDMFPNMCMPGIAVIKNIKKCLESGKKYKSNLPPGTVI